MKAHLLSLTDNLNNEHVYLIITIMKALSYQLLFLIILQVYKADFKSVFSCDVLSQVYKSKQSQAETDILCGQPVTTNGLTEQSGNVIFGTREKPGQYLAGITISHETLDNQPYYCIAYTPSSMNYYAESSFNCETLPGNRSSAAQIVLSSSESNADSAKERTKLASELGKNSIITDIFDSEIVTIGNIVTKQMKTGVNAGDWDSEKYASSVMDSLSKIIFPINCNKGGEKSCVINICNMDKFYAKNKELSLSNPLKKYVFLSEDCNKQQLNSSEQMDFYSLISVRVNLVNELQVRVAIEAPRAATYFTLSNSSFGSGTVNLTEHEKQIINVMNNLVNFVDTEDVTDVFDFNATSLYIPVMAVINSMEVNQVNNIKDGKNSGSINNELVYIGNRENFMINGIKMPKQVGEFASINTSSPKQLFTINQLPVEEGMDKNQPPAYLPGKFVKIPDVHNYLISQFFETNFIRLIYLIRREDLVYVDIFDFEDAFRPSFLIKFATMYRTYEYLLPREGYNTLKALTDPVVAKIIAMMETQKNLIKQDGNPELIRMEEVKAYLISKLVGEQACIVNSPDLGVENFVIYTPKSHQRIQADNKMKATVNGSEVSIPECPADINNRNFQKTISVGEIHILKDTYRVVINHLLHRMKSEAHSDVPKIISTSFEFNKKYNHNHTSAVLDDIDVIFDGKIADARQRYTLAKPNARILLNKHQENESQNLLGSAVRSDDDIRKLRAASREEELIAFVKRQLSKGRGSNEKIIIK